MNLTIWWVFSNQTWPKPPSLTHQVVIIVFHLFQRYPLLVWNVFWSVFLFQTNLQSVFSHYLFPKSKCCLFNRFTLYLKVGEKLNFITSILVGGKKSITFMTSKNKKTSKVFFDLKGHVLLRGKRLDLLIFKVAVWTHSSILIYYGIHILSSPFHRNMFMFELSVLSLSLLLLLLLSLL